MLALLLGAGLTITPPPVVADEPPGDDGGGGKCNLQDPASCFPGDEVPVPNPCNMISRLCDLPLPELCKQPQDCICTSSPSSVSIEEARVCGIPVNPCAAVLANSLPCTCVHVPTTGTIYQVGLGPKSLSCGVAVPSPEPGPPGPGQPPNPCEGQDACECASVAALSFNLGSAGEICGISTNPCDIVTGGQPNDGCGCVQAGGPQRGVIQAVVGGDDVIPTSVCGVPVEPCVFLGLVCECFASLSFIYIGSLPRVLAPPALCIPVPTTQTPCIDGIVDGIVTNQSIILSPDGVYQCVVGGPPPLPTVQAFTTLQQEEVAPSGAQVGSYCKGTKVWHQGTLSASASVQAGYGPVSAGVSHSATVSGDYALNWDYTCKVNWDIWGRGSGALLRTVRAVLLTGGQENHTAEYFCDYPGAPVKPGCQASAANEVDPAPKHSGQYVQSASGFAWAWNAANNTGGSYPLQVKFCFKDGTAAKAWNYALLPLGSIQDTHVAGPNDCIELPIHYTETTAIVEACTATDTVTGLASLGNPLPVC